MPYKVSKQEPVLTLYKFLKFLNAVYLNRLINKVIN